jgi:hypothetical protein
MRVVYGQVVKAGMIRRVRVEYRKAHGAGTVIPLEAWRPIPVGATLQDLRITPEEREHGWPEDGHV